MVSLLLELDIHLPTDRSSLLVDHFNYDTVSAAETHDVVLVPRPSALRDGVKNYFGGKDGNKDILAFPHGVGQLLGNASPLLTPILRAPRTAYSYSPKEEAEGSDDPFGVGAQLNLISSMQARNSARFTVLGAAEMLEDDWFGAEVQPAGAEKRKTANEEFAKEVSAWAFKELGVLQVGSITHFLDEGETMNATDLNPKIYRVKNEVVGIHLYLIDLRLATLSRPNPNIVLRYRTLRVHLRQVDPIHPTNRRLRPTRVLHALPLPPPLASNHSPNSILQHLQHAVQDAGSARHLQLLRRVQKTILDDRGGEEHCYRAPLCAR